MKIKNKSCQMRKKVIKAVAWTDDREAEGARLEIVCTPKGYRGFESHSVRQLKARCKAGFFVV